MGRGQLDHLARSDEQEPLVGDCREDALGQLHGRGGHRYRCGADVGLTTNVLRDGERALEQAIQDEAKAAGGFRAPHRLFHLAQDLRLAQHHRIEAARNPESVFDGALARQRVEVRRQRIPRDAVEVLQPAHHGLRVGPVDVDLGAIAGRQDRCLADLRPTNEIAQRVAQRILGERDLLPHGDRRRLVVQAEGIEGHRDALC